MNVNHTPASLAPTMAALRLRVRQYLELHLTRNTTQTDQAIRVKTSEIYDKLKNLLLKASYSPASVKGICIRVKNHEGHFVMSYAVYLHACALLLGYNSWQDAMIQQTKGGMIPSLYYKVFSETFSVPIRESIPKAKGLAALSKGMPVHWSKLKAILCKLSDQDMHPHIDSLLLEMQMAVGVTTPSDPRGDMLFAVFNDETEEDSYIILGERYRPPNEVNGKYRTVMVKVKTYSMSNRIMSVSTPNGDSYSPFTIKQLVQHVRDQRKAVVAEITSWVVKK